MTRRERDQVTKAFPFFSTVPSSSVEALLAQSVRRSLGHKQVLARDGGECAYLPFVLQGTLRIYKASQGGKELTLYRIERGESCILSATCILNGGSFPAVAEAEGAADVLLVPAKVLLRLVEDNAGWRRYVFGLYSRRLEEVLSLVEEVAFHHVDTRIAAYLTRRAAAHKGVVTRTHVEIADELGTSREVVTRILRDFEAEGLIATARGKVRVLSPDALRQRAAAAADA
jgi:CRP/FNR family transcriptional regulator